MHRVGTNRIPGDAHVRVYNGLRLFRQRQHGFSPDGCQRRDLVELQGCGYCGRLRFSRLLYDVPAEQIGAQVIEAQGRAATVKATMPARECDLTLMKNADANKYGWVVQVHSCHGL